MSDQDRTRILCPPRGQCYPCKWDKESYYCDTFRGCHNSNLPCHSSEPWCLTMIGLAFSTPTSLFNVPYINQWTSYMNTSTIISSDKPWNFSPTPFKVEGSYYGDTQLYIAVFVHDRYAAHFRWELHNYTASIAGIILMHVLSLQRLKTGSNCKGGSAKVDKLRSCVSGIQFFLPPRWKQAKERFVHTWDWCSKTHTLYILLIGKLYG